MKNLAYFVCSLTPGRLFKVLKMLLLQRVVNFYCHIFLPCQFRPVACLVVAWKAGFLLLLVLDQFNCIRQDSFWGVGGEVSCLRPGFSPHGVITRGRATERVSVDVTALECGDGLAAATPYLV